MIQENTPTAQGEFLMCYWGQIFQDAETGKKERLTVVDISYIADGRKKGILFLKPLNLITDEHAIYLGFSSAFQFRGNLANIPNFIYLYLDELRKFGYAVPFRRIPPEILIERKWISLYSH